MKEKIISFALFLATFISIFCVTGKMIIVAVCVTSFMLAIFIYYASGAADYEREEDEE